MSGKHDPNCTVTCVHSVPGECKIDTPRDECERAFDECNLGLRVTTTRESLELFRAGYRARGEKDVGIVEDEEEPNGPMPQVLWDAIRHADRRVVEGQLRQLVQLTKRDISTAIRAVDEEKP